MANPIDLETIVKSYRTAERRVQFLDYDGALVPLDDLPEKSMLPDQTRNLKLKLSSDPGNSVYIARGRVRRFPIRQLAGTGVRLIAEQWMWLKENNGNWKRSSSVAFHFRTAENFVDRERRPIRERLACLTSNFCRTTSRILDRKGWCFTDPCQVSHERPG